MRFYISAQYDVGQLSYSKKREDGGGYDTFIDADSEADAIKVFKAYAAGSKNPFDPDAKPKQLLLNSEEHPEVKVIDW